MKYKTALNSPKIEQVKKKRREALIRKISIFLSFFVVCLILLSILFRWSAINIQNIEITGNKVVEAKDIEEAIRKDTSGNYYWLFPKTNFIFYPQNEVKNNLAQNFKRLKNISLEVHELKKLKVEVTEREPVYTWCGYDLPPLEIKLEDSRCFFIDNEGYVFDEAPRFSGSVYFRFYGGLEGNKKSEQNEDLLDNAPGSYFLKSNFAKISAFKKSISNMGLKPISLFVKPDGDIEIYLSSAMPPEGPKIIFKTDSDYEKLVDNLQTVLETEPLKTEIKTKYNSLLYIDLRFGNKVYYKFK